MQTFIDFLANNYLWFIIIALILVFALIGYLVDTSEKSGNASNLEEQMLEEDDGVAENSNGLNMDMGPEELDKDVIVMSSTLNDSTNADQDVEPPEVLDVK